MSHDPLCRATSGTFCDCPLIARVREDERTHIYSSEAMEAVIQLAASKAYDAALQDAVNEVMHLIPPHYGQEPHSYDMNTADFIAAIEALGGER